MAGKRVIIAGGGISGLAALHFLCSLKPEYDVTLYEADTRLGGTIGTDHIDGYSFDAGPNGFLDREPLTLRLCEELGLNDKLERANERVNNRFILRGGRLRAVPMSPPKFLLSDILSVPGRLRVMYEPFAHRRTDEDESVYDFARRRIGREAADYLVQPMVSGVYGGVAERLSLKSCFRIMREMEDEYGSLLKAMIAKKKQAKAAGRKGGGPSGPGGWLTSFYGGLYAIIERFGELYGEYIITGKGVRSLDKEGETYTVQFSDGKTEHADIVILGVPSYHAARIVSELSVPLAAALAEIPYAPISVVCMGFDRGAVRADLDGFGFLVPRVEKRRILGSIWTSSIFADRAPEGKVQFRTMVGGDGDHESMDLPEDELIKIVTDEMHDILGISGEPEVVKTYRWRCGIPQFTIGHAARLAVIEREVQTLGNIFITGNSYHGISLNDCVKQSYAVVNSL